MPALNAWSETRVQPPINPRVRTTRRHPAGLRAALVPQPPLPYATPFGASAHGTHRFSDDSLVGYLLYRAEDDDPMDFGSPQASFTGLPYITAALANNTTHRLVVRRRNEYGLISQNVAEFQVQIGAGGAAGAIPPSAPSNTAAAPAAAGTILITSRYDYLADGTRAADTWLLFLRADGTNPDPSIDTPVTIAMVKNDGVARLDHTTAAYGEGATVKVVVRTRRSGSPYVDSINDSTVTAVATYQGPDAPAPAGIFLGVQAEQAQ